MSYRRFANLSSIGGSRGKIEGKNVTHVSVFFYFSAWVQKTPSKNCRRFAAKILQKHSKNSRRFAAIFFQFTDSSNDTDIISYYVGWRERAQREHFGFRCLVFRFSIEISVFPVSNNVCSIREWCIWSDTFLYPRISPRYFLYPSSGRPISLGTNLYPFGYKKKHWFGGLFVIDVSRTVDPRPSCGNPEYHTQLSPASRRFVPSII